MPKVTTILAVATAAVGIALVVAALLPSTYELSRSRDIAASAAELSSLVADFSRRTEWIPWAATEPSATFRAEGGAGTIGSRFSWDGQEIGEGTATLTQHQPGQFVETTLHFQRPMTMSSLDRVTFTSIPGGGTRVTWTNTGTLPYPLGRVFGLVIDRIVGAEYADGLARLESAVTRPTTTAAR